MLPEGDVIVFAFVPVEPEAWLLSDGLLGESGRASVGVGGVTCVAGASKEVLVGVLGAVTIVGMSRMLVVGLLGLVSNDWTLSEVFEGLPRLALPHLSFLNKAPRAFPSVDSTNPRSGLFGGLTSFFWGPMVKTSLILALGETPRLLLPSAALRDLPPSLLSIVAACWGARSEVRDCVLAVAGKVSDLWYCGFWKAGLSSWKLLGISGWGLVLTKGEEEVR